MGLFGGLVSEVGLLVLLLLLFLLLLLGEMGCVEGVLVDAV